MSDNKKNIVDCHMHALTKDEFKLYSKTASANKFINIRGLYIDEMLDPYDFDEFIDNENMYFIDSVDLDDVDNELIKIEDDINKYPRIIAVKIYLGYQKYYANDKKIYKVCEFASKHNLSVTFHCGEIYDDNGESSASPYSNAISNTRYKEMIRRRLKKANEKGLIMLFLKEEHFEDLNCIKGLLDSLKYSKER